MLVFDLDREYDGTYEERLKGASFPVTFADEGTYRAKVRVTDSTGKERAGLALIEVKKGIPVDPGTGPEDHPDPETFTQEEGCGCSIPGNDR